MCIRDRHRASTCRARARHEPPDRPDGSRRTATRRPETYLMHGEVITELLADLVALRRDLHAHPELAFAEHRTAGIVAGALRELGLEVHEGIAGTGVVGVLSHG